MNTILLIAAIFGFVLTSLLFFRKTAHNTASFFLGSFYFIISVYALQTYLIDTDQLEKLRWFFIWPLLLYHLIMIPVYFYFVTVIKDEFRWKNKYLLLFVPFLLGVVDVVSVYMAPPSVYAQLLESATSNTAERLDAHYWLLSLNEHYLIRHLWQLGSLFFILPELRKFLNEGITDKLKLTLNKWLVFFWTTMTTLSLLAILHGLEKLFGISTFGYILGIRDGSVVLTMFLYLTVFVIGIIPIYFPSILHGYPRRKKVEPLSIKNNSNNRNENKRTEDSKFNMDEADIEKKLKTLIENKSYLNTEFTVTTCARDMDLPAHHLSYFISKFYGQNFASYKNDLRIAYAKKLMDSGFLEHSTMEALANTCGYGNRSSFSKTFKAVTNQSPSEYLQHKK